MLEIAFKGTHAAIVGETNPHGGYAKVSVLNAEKDTVYSSLVDFYSKYPEKSNSNYNTENAEGKLYLTG